MVSPIIRPPCSHSIESFPFRAYLQPDTQPNLPPPFDRCSASLLIPYHLPQPSLRSSWPTGLEVWHSQASGVDLVMHPLIGRSSGGHESSRANRFVPPTQPATGAKATKPILSHQFGRPTTPLGNGRIRAPKRPINLATSTEFLLGNPPSTNPIAMHVGTPLCTTGCETHLP